MRISAKSPGFACNHRQRTSAWLDARVLVVAFLLFFGAALLYLWESKYDKQRRASRAAKIQTEHLLKLYANATKELVTECGYDRVVAVKIPEVFTNNPGWTAWRGPYIRGDVRAIDYYGTPITFVFSNGIFIQISAGLDRKFGTPDDLFLKTELPTRQQ